MKKILLVFLCVIFFNSLKTNAIVDSTYAAIGKIAKAVTVKSLILGTGFYFVGSSLNHLTQQNYHLEKYFLKGAAAGILFGYSLPSNGFLQGAFGACYGMALVSMPIIKVVFSELFRRWSGGN